MNVVAETRLLNEIKTCVFPKFFQFDYHTSIITGYALENKGIQSPNANKTLFSLSLKSISFA